jgi:hypothetical protein
VPTLIVRTRQTVHANCGQRCGQQVIALAKPAPLGPRALGAQKNSSQKVMQIKHLHENDDSVTVPATRAPGGAASVEFRAAACHG